VVLGRQTTSDEFCVGKKVFLIRAILVNVHEIVIVKIADLLRSIKVQNAERRLRTVWHLEETTRSSAKMPGGAGHHEHRALSF